MNNLFRKEVFEQKLSERAGETIIVSSLSFKVLAGFVAVLVIAIGCFLYWGTYTNKQTVSGYILPSKGLITIYAPQRGTVAARYVRLGDHVHKSQKLYLISLERSTLQTENVNVSLLKQFDTQLHSIHERIKLARNLEASKLDQLQRQQHDLQIEYTHLNKQLQTENSILALTQKNFLRYQTLARNGMVSQSDWQQVQQKTLDQQAAVEEIEKSQIELRAKLDQIPTEISQAKANTAATIANLKNQAAQIEQQRLQLQVTQEVVVRAPAAGTVSSVMIRVGQNVTTETPLMSILPQGSVFEAQLLVPTRAIGFVHAGEPVRLRYSAFPYQQFGLYRGQVREVSRSIISVGELNLPVALQEPYYLVTVSLDRPYVSAYGRRMPLTAGMTLNADIVLNHERLYEWVLRPLESLRGSM